MFTTYVLSIHETAAKVGLSKPTIYRLMGEGKFPRPLKLSAHRVAWRVLDIDNWLANLPQAGGVQHV